MRAKLVFLVTTLFSLMPLASPFVYPMRGTLTRKPPQRGRRKSRQYFAPREYVDHSINPPKSEIETLGSSLELLVANLKSFGSGSVFNYHLFESHIGRFREELSDIEFNIEVSSLHNELALLLSFARKMYLTMVDASAKMKRYARKKLMGHDLVYKMIELHVRTLTMYNAIGGVDVSLQSPKHKVALFLRLLHLLEGEIQKMADLSAGVRAVFHSYFIETYRLLAALDSQNMEEEWWIQ